MSGKRGMHGVYIKLVAGENRRNVTFQFIAPLWEEVLWNYMLMRVLAGTKISVCIEAYDLYLELRCERERENSE